MRQRRNPAGLNDRVEQAAESALEAVGAIDTVRSGFDGIRASAQIIKQKLERARKAFDAVSDNLEAAEEAFGDVEGYLDEIEEQDIAEHVGALERVSKVLEEISSIDLES